MPTKAKKPNSKTSKAKRPKKLTNAPTVIQKNHFIYVYDHSGSMTDHANGAKTLANKQIEKIKDATDQQNHVTIFTFGEDEKPYKEKMFNVSINQVPTVDKWLCNNGTPLFDAVKAAIQRVNDSDPDLSILVFVLTDGEENQSKTTAQALSDLIREKTATDRWTFAFMVPPALQWKSYKNDLVAKLGLPVGNVQEWGDIKKAEEIATGSTVSYLAQRRKGVRSMKTYFAADLSKVRKGDLKQLDDITSDVKIWNVDKEDRIDDFVRSHKENGAPVTYVAGTGFYQVMKKERKVQPYKKLVLVDKGTGKVYASSADLSVRELLGFPVGEDIALEPGNHANFEMYCQSNSDNRKLPRGTKLIRWAGANSHTHV